MFIHLYGMNLLNLFLFFMPVAGLSFYAWYHWLRPCARSRRCCRPCIYQAVAQISAFTGIFDTFCCRLGLCRFFDPPMAVLTTGLQQAFFFWASPFSRAADRPRQLHFQQPPSGSGKGLLPRPVFIGRHDLRYSFPDDICLFSGAGHWSCCFP